MNLKKSQNSFINTIKETDPFDYSFDDFFDKMSRNLKYDNYVLEMIHHYPSNWYHDLSKQQRNQLKTWILKNMDHDYFKNLSLAHILTTKEYQKYCMK